MRDDFSQKEILGRIWDETQKQSVQITTLVTKMQAVEQHLADLNSKVAKHEQRLNEHGNFITKVTAYATLGATAFTFVINRYF